MSLLNFLSRQADRFYAAGWPYWSVMAALAAWNGYVLWGIFFRGGCK